MAKPSRLIARRQIRRLLTQARQEGRSFEELFLEMFPEDSSSASEDDCRPLDTLTADTFSQTGTQSENSTETAPRPSISSETPLSQHNERAAAIADLARSIQQSRGQIQESHTADAGAEVLEEHDSAYERGIEAQADRVYRRGLMNEVLGIWRDLVSQHGRQEYEADLICDEKLVRQSLGTLLDDFHAADDTERRKRLKMFLAWNDRRLAIGAFRAWIVRHRENVVSQQSEEDQNLRAAATALSRWHTRAAELMKRKQKFKRFFLASKFGRRWLNAVYDRRVSRAMAVLEERYRAYRRQRDVKILGKFLAGWQRRSVNLAAMEATADEHVVKQASQRTSQAAHRGLTQMYIATAEMREAEMKADDRYDTMLVARVLCADSPWRTKTTKVQEQDVMAEQFETIKDQERAQQGFRKMRKAAAWGQKTEENADAFYDRISIHQGRQALRQWRHKFAVKRGEVVAQEPPATPAARMTALRQYRQSQMQYTNG
jgi:hypothetical protein